MYDHVWVPSYPDKWLSPDHNHFRSIGLVQHEFDTFIDVFSHAVRLKQWNHYTGASDTTEVDIIECHQTPDWGPAKAAYRYLIKHQSVTEARALVSVLMCRSWTPERKWSAFGTSTQCPRCGAAVENVYHRFWACPNNDELGTDVSCTNRHRDRARQADEKILWTRWVVPGEWRPKRRAAITRLARTTPNWDELACNPATFFGTDGSCGKGNSIPSLRMVGAWASARLVTPEGNVQYAHLYATVRGRQTVPRAKLVAITETLQRIPAHLHPTVKVDSTYVAKGIAKSHQLRKNRNDDLWMRLNTVTNGRMRTPRPFTSCNST